MKQKTILSIKLLSYMFFYLLLIQSSISSFDHTHYIKKNRLTQFTDNDFSCSLNHFARFGRKQGLESATTNIENSNFDWKYYVEHNKLPHITTEQQAYDHYIHYGESKNLPYCKPLSIVITMHLYDLDLMDELVNRVNYFINNNPHNKYLIKINVPVDERLLALDDFYVDYASYDTDNENNAFLFLKNKITNLGPSIGTKIKELNCTFLLNQIHNHLKKSFVVPQDNIQIIFSDNKGMDIGGFFVLLNEMKKENTQFDFLIKIHSKKGPSHYGNQFGTTWKNCLLSFLNLKINKILNTYDAIYPCKLSSLNDPERHNPLFKKKQNNLCALLNIPFNIEYEFAAGTMFVVPYAFFDTVKKWDFNLIYSLLVNGRSSLGYEHIFERLFGYIGKTTCSNIACFNYIPRGYPTIDNVE